MSKKNPHYMWRRFTPITNNVEPLAKLVAEKDLSNEDIELILRTIKLHPDYVNDGEMKLKHMNLEQRIKMAKRSGKAIYIPDSRKIGKTTLAKQLRAEGYVVYEEFEMFTLTIE